MPLPSPTLTQLNACLSLYFYMFCSHYPSVESEHCDEGQGATAEDSGTKESEDERGTDFKRQRSGSKDKKGVRERELEKEKEREREIERERERKKERRW